MILLASLQIASIPLVAARKNLCNKVGWDSGRESFTSTDATSLAECADDCGKHRKCKSYAFAIGDCELYDTHVKGNFIRDSSSPYAFYDAGCGGNVRGRVSLTASSSDAAAASTIAAASSSAAAGTFAAASSESAAASSAAIGTAAATSFGAAASSDSAATSAAAASSSAVADTAAAATSGAAAVSSDAAASSDSAASSTDYSYPLPPYVTPIPVTSGQVCDEPGYFTGDDKYSLDIISVWDQPAYEQTKLYCYNLCKGESSCLSYAYNIGACSLFSAVLAGNFSEASDSVADFWEMSCGPPPASPDDITATSDISAAATSYDSAAASTDAGAVVTATIAGSAASTVDAANAESPATAATTEADSAASTTDAGDFAPSAAATSAAATTNPDSAATTIDPSDSAAVPSAAATTSADSAAATTDAADSAPSAAATSVAAESYVLTTHIGTPASTTIAGRVRRYHPRRRAKIS